MMILGIRSGGGGGFCRTRQVASSVLRRSRVATRRWLNESKEAITKEGSTTAAKEEGGSSTTTTSAAAKEATTKEGSTTATKEGGSSTTTTAAAAEEAATMESSTIAAKEGGSSTAAAAAAAAKEETKTKRGWWYSAELWGGLGALAGWGMSGSAIYDAALQGPEVISLTMTPVLLVYSSLFAYWAYIIIPQNLLLCGCHVANILAQSNQLRRALEYKMANGEEEEVKKMGKKAAMGGTAIAASIAAGPAMRRFLTSNADYGVISAIAAADAGPFTVHFWAPMSKWLISGASFFELNRPTEKISLAQYSALTLTGFFFSRYSLLVTPVNYTLCSVNIALFTSSAWHLGRKINADYLHIGVGTNGSANKAKEAAAKEAVAAKEAAKEAVAAKEAAVAAAEKETKTDAKKY